MAVIALLTLLLHQQREGRDWRQVNLATLEVAQRNSRDNLAREAGLRFRLGQELHTRGAHGAAETELTEALALQLQQAPADPLALARTRIALARTCSARGRHGEAARRLRAVIVALGEQHGDSAELSAARHDYAAILRRLGRDREAGHVLSVTR